MTPPPATGRRRGLLQAAGAVAAAGIAPLRLLANRLPVVGVVYPGQPPAEPGGALHRFLAGLAELGLVDGRQVVVDVRFDGHRTERMAELLREFDARPVDVIVVAHTGSALAARRVVTRVPVVFAVAGDPVGSGLVASLAEPGGRLTGISIMSPELNQRRLQLLTEAVPRLRRVGVLADTNNDLWQREFDGYASLAPQLQLSVVALPVAANGDAAAVLAEARRHPLHGLVLLQTPGFSAQRTRLAALMLEHRLPSLAGSGDGHYARAGGLMNYGASIGASWHRAATFVHRILQGADPARLPVEQPTRFELVINRATARALGLALPEHLLVLADEVIG